MTDIHADLEALRASALHAQSALHALHALIPKSYAPNTVSAKHYAWRHHGDKLAFDRGSISVPNISGLSAHETLAMHTALGHAQDASADMAQHMGHIAARLAQGPAYRATDRGAGLIISMTATSERRIWGHIVAHTGAKSRHKRHSGQTGTFGFEKPTFFALCALAEQADGMGEGPHWTVWGEGKSPTVPIQARTAMDALIWAAVAYNGEFLTGRDIQVAQNTPDSKALQSALREKAQALLSGKTGP